MGALANTKIKLAAAVAAGATVSVPYPAGTNQAALADTTGGVIAVDGNIWRQGAGGFTVTFGASDITVTNDSGVSWAAGSELIASFGRTDINGSYNLTNPRQVQEAVEAL